MPISSKDIVPLSKLRSRLAEVAEEVRDGAEKVITKNGESYVALVDARRLDHYHRLEREHIHLTLLNEAALGLADVREGALVTADDLKARFLGDG